MWKKIVALRRIHKQIQRHVPLSAIHKETTQQYTLLSARVIFLFVFKELIYRNANTAATRLVRVQHLILNSKNKLQRVNGDLIFTRVILRDGGEESLRIEKARYPQRGGIHGAERALHKQNQVAAPQRKVLGARE